MPTSLCASRTPTRGLGAALCSGCVGRMTFTPGNASLSAPRVGKQTRCPWSKGLPWSISPFPQGGQQPSTGRILGPRSPALALGGTPSYRWEQVLLMERHPPGARSLRPQTSRLWECKRLAAPPGLAWLRWVAKFNRQFPCHVMGCDRPAHPVCWPRGLE